MRRKNTVPNTPIPLLPSENRRFHNKLWHVEEERQLNGQGEKE